MSSDMVADDAIREVNRAIAYAAQVAAIGTNGLMDTFLAPDVPWPGTPRLIRLMRAAPFDEPPVEWTEPTVLSVEDMRHSLYPFSDT
jgi:hypothetical protein